MLTGLATHRRLPLFAAFGALGALHAGMAYFLWGTAGAGLADERTFLAISASQISELIYGPPDWPRYYFLWYKFLGLFFDSAAPETSPSAIIAVNSLTVSLVFSLATFFYVRSISGSISFALAASLILTVSVLNIPNWSKPSHVALTIVLVAMLVTVRTHSLYVRWLVVAVGLLLASFRPEMFMAFVLATAVTSCLALRHAKDSGAIRAHFAFASFMVLVACYHLEFGLPLLTSSGRSQLAIQQHFALNWVRWTESALHPWIEHDQIWRTNFGAARGPLQAFLANPAAILRHLGENTVGTVVRIMAAPFTPVGARWNFVATYAETHVKYVLLGFLPFVVCTLYCLKRYGAGDKIRREAAVWAVVLAPVIASAIDIYPRDHHTLWVATGLLSLGAAAIARAVHVGATGELDREGLSKKYAAG